MTQHPETPPYLSSQLLQRIGGKKIHHGFFGREGGVSTGLYRSLNCAPASRDEPDNIATNRQRCRTALGARWLYTARQTHSAQAVFLDAPPTPAAALIEADALVTNVSGLAIGVLAADCMSVLFWDPGANLIAAAHAGWRGALRGILPECLRVMTDYGATPKSVHVAFGPSLRRANFEVRADLREAFLASTPEAAAFFDAVPAQRRLNPEQEPASRQALQPAKIGEKWLFDLIGFARAQLISLDVPAAQIDILPFCTLDAPKNYFSYRVTCQRGETDFGRHLSAIVRSDSKERYN